MHLRSSRPSERNKTKNTTPLMGNGTFCLHTRSDTKSFRFVIQFFLFCQRAIPAFDTFLVPLATALISLIHSLCFIFPNFPKLSTMNLLLFLTVGSTSGDSGSNPSPSFLLFCATLSFSACCDGPCLLACLCESSLLC